MEASPIERSLSITPKIILSTAAGMSDPPGDPVIKDKRSFSSNTMVGAIVLIGLFPGTKALPGLTLRETRSGLPT